MPPRLGPGPVFVYESIIAARRWQVYATRAGFVLALLGGLTIAGMSVDSNFSNQSSIQKMAKLGESFYYAIATVQIAVVLLVAPAATAGAICQERARGSLTHMLVTDLSNAEIVLGKLGARLAPVVALVFAGVPVLALASLLGGIIPETLLTLTLESLAIATLGCALALAVSVRARKTHEVVLVVYAIWVAWVFGSDFLSIVLSLGAGSPARDWLKWLNPFVIAWAPYAWPGYLSISDLAVFFMVTLGASGLLVVYAIARLRSEVWSGTNPRRSRILTRLAALRPGPKLDDNPVLWREWHRNRPSRATRLVWAFYYLVAIGGTAAIIINMADGDPRKMAGTLCEFTALHVAIGLLLVSLSAPCALAEERVRAGLDVLLTTPLSSASVVWAKWRGAYRNVPALMVLPLFCSLLVAVSAERDISSAVFVPGATVPVSMVVYRLGFWDRLAAAAVPPALILAQGALLTSLGLSLAVWIRKVGRAMTLSVVASLALAIGPILVVELGMTNWALRTCGLAPPAQMREIAPNLYQQMGVRSKVENAINAGLVSLSTFGGQYEAPAALYSPQELGIKTLWAVESTVLMVLLATSATLYGLTLLSFNRCLGRVPERARRPGVDPERWREPVPKVRREVVSVG